MPKPTMHEFLDGKNFDLPERHDLAKKVLMFTELYGPKPNGSDAAKEFQIDMAALCEAAIRLFVKRSWRAKGKR